MKNFVLGMLCAVLISIGIACFLAWRGSIDFGADHPPSPAEAAIAMRAVDLWSEGNSRGLQNPLPATDANIIEGATLYLNHCAGCHGIPSNPDSNFQQSFYPPAPGFFRQMPDMTDSSTFYVMKRGIRWTGMPAWDRTLTDTQIWRIVLFFDNMHKLPPAAQKVFEPDVSKTTGAK